jgi:hypothetical protein
VVADDVRFGCTHRSYGARYRIRGLGRSMTAAVAAGSADRWRDSVEARGKLRLPAAHGTRGWRMSVRTRLARVTTGSVAENANGLGTGLGDRYRVLPGPRGHLDEEVDNSPGGASSQGKQGGKRGSSDAPTNLLASMLRRGVDGSSPSEGFAQAPLTRLFSQIHLQSVLCAAGLDPVTDPSDGKLRPQDRR